MLSHYFARNWMKVKEERREKRALSKGVCTSVANVSLNILTPMALDWSLCTEEAFLWMSCSANILFHASLEFYGRVRTLMCFTCPEFLVLPPFPSSAWQTPPSKAMCWQLCGTQGLAFVPTYTLLCQVSDFARNTRSRAADQGMDPLFSWSRCLCLLLVQMHPLKVLGVDMAPGSLAVPWTRLRLEDMFV